MNLNPISAFKNKAKNERGITVKIFLALMLCLITVLPCHAFKLNGRKILGAPFYAIGFGTALLVDITLVPFGKGQYKYHTAPAVKGW